jgi:hypothetical protein
MGLGSFKKIQSDDDVQNRFQDNVANALDPIVQQEILGGNLLRGISILTGVDNNVPHKLGRKLLGWMLVRNRANSVVWDSQDFNLSQNSTLILNCSANTTIDLWVF